MTQFGDVAGNAVIYQAFKPQTFTTTTTSTNMDFGEGGGGQFGTTMILTKGTVTGSTGTLDFKLQECATTNGTFTDISGATFATQTTSGADGDVPLIKTVFNRNGRYVRAVATTGGTSPSFIYGGLVVMEQKRVT